MKKSKLYTILALCVAFIASIALTAVTAFAEDTLVDVSGWAWGGQNDGNWTNEKLEDGSYHLTQTEASQWGRYPNSTDLHLNGLVLDVEFNAPGAFVISAFNWNTYNGHAPVFKLTYDAYGRSMLSIDGDGKGENGTPKIYENADDALNMVNPGLHISGSPYKSLIINNLTPKINFRFKQYSTYRYIVTITCEDFVDGITGMEGKSVSYYMNADEFDQLFGGGDKCHFTALGNSAADSGWCNASDKLAEMTVKVWQGEKATEIIEDPIPVDDYFEEYKTKELEPSEGKKIMKFTDKDVITTGDECEADVYENGVVTITNPNADGNDWGIRSGMTKALVLDGLKITSYYSRFKKSDLVSLFLGDNGQAYYGSGGLCIVYSYYDTNQPRLYVCANHDINNANSAGNPSYIYKTEEGARNKTAEDKNTCIIYDGATTLEYSVEFTKIDEEVYKLTFVTLNEANFHWANNFGEEKKDDKTVEYYINVTEMYGGGENSQPGNHLLDNGGMTHICAAAPFNAPNRGNIAYYVEEPEGYIDTCEIELEHEEYVYAGEPIEAKVVSVKSGELVFTEDDYEVTYLNNDSIGTATVVVTFKGQYMGSFTKNYQIIGRDASAAVITLEYTSVVYTTMENRPKIVSVMLGEESIASTNYMVTYANNVDPGTATVTLKFMNDYSGTASTTFEITKIQKNTEGEHVELSGDVAYADLLTLGGDYTYTVTDSEGNVVEEGAKLKGDYTVKAVKESKTTVETVTYTVTVIGSQKVDCRSCKSSMGTCGIISLIALGFAAIKRRKI